MMLESRAAYGYYGEGHGATGETAPKTHKSGWRIWTFYFDTMWPAGKETVQINACDYEHAMKQLKQWQKRDGFEIIGLHN